MRDLRDNNEYALNVRVVVSINKFCDVKLSVMLILYAIKSASCLHVLMM